MMTRKCGLTPLRPADAALTVDLADEVTDTTMVDGTGTFDGADITVKVPEQLAVTVMTSRVSRATIALPTGDDTYNGDAAATGAAPETHTIVGVDHDDDADTTAVIDVTVPSAVAAWWDGLTDTQKNCGNGGQDDRPRCHK